MTDERQKKTTEEYCNNWNEIFKKPKQQPKDKCCNQECDQGRNCVKGKNEDNLG